MVGTRAAAAQTPPGQAWAPFPLDLALRASNRAEQACVLSAVFGGPTRWPRAALDPLTGWRVARLADLLADQLLPEGVTDPAALVRLQEEYRHCLGAWAAWEKEPRGLDGPAGSALEQVHASWLPTYAAALDGFDPTTGIPGASWRAPDTFYPRFAWACDPFLAHIRRSVQAVAEAANRQVGAERFEAGFLAGIERGFLERVELALAWAIEADKNVYCARAGIDPEQSHEQDFHSYIGETFADADAYHRFYLRFPVLGRWLATLAALACADGKRLIGRLLADTEDLGTSLFGEPIWAFSAVVAGCGDAHAGGQSVAQVHVRLRTGAAAFVYKPHSLVAERAVQDLVASITASGGPRFGRYRILLRDGYGYEELLATGANRVASPVAAGMVYRELGAYLAVFHALGGGDLHFENVRIAGGHAFVCDCESALAVRLSGQQLPVDTVLDSVYKTGLLEWPQLPTSSGTIRLSGYAGGESFTLPAPIPRISADRSSLRLGVRQTAGVRVEPDAANRVFVGTELCAPAQFRDDIVDGFTAGHEWFEVHRDAALAQVAEGFATAEVRFVNWATQVYSQLLASLRHPKCLMDPLEADLVINRVLKHRRAWDRDGLLAGAEAASLWQWDVPLFSSQATAGTLLHDHTVATGVRLAQPPLEECLARIGRLTAENRARQTRYIVASLVPEEVHGAAFVAAATEYATRVGWRLLAEMRDGDAAPWDSYQLTPDGPTNTAITGDLYNGSAGLALFLAYLDALAPERLFRDAADRALRHALAALPEGIGAYTGAGGVLYVLTHLYHLWGERALLDHALALADRLGEGIDRDRHFDVLAGAAGMIPVLASLDAVAAGRGREGATRCGEHLLRHAERRETTLSWPLANPADGMDNLTGFAHGAGGVGWALISLGRATGRPDWVDAGRAAFGYERRHYDEARGDWYDLRTSIIARARGRRSFANAWCNGSAGIGLSRIASWAALRSPAEPEETLEREAHMALSATLRTFGTLNNDSLCHGRCGNAELLLRFSLLHGDPAFQMEANVQARSQWRRLDQEGRLMAGAAGEKLYPGLMLGLAGIGMHFLRLAHPDAVPSPLLLDPPPQSRSPRGAAT